MTLPPLGCYAINLIILTQMSCTSRPRTQLDTHWLKELKDVHTRPIFPRERRRWDSWWWLCLLQLLAPWPLLPYNNSPSVGGKWQEGPHVWIFLSSEASYRTPSPDTAPSLSLKDVISGYKWNYLSSALWGERDGQEVSQPRHFGSSQLEKSTASNRGPQAWYSPAAPGKVVLSTDSWAVA